MLVLHQFRQRDIHAEIGIDAIAHLDGNQGIDAQIAQRLLRVDTSRRASQSPREVIPM